MARSKSNTSSRRQALQMMFQQEFLGFDLAQLDANASDVLVVSRVPKNAKDTDLVGEPVNDYTKELISCVVEHLGQIDSWIKPTAQNWTIDRMQIVDRNIIRLASAEIAFFDVIPTGVAINEAVELAKIFGSDDSPKFVNGVLGRIADMLEDGIPPYDPEAEAAAEAEAEAVAEANAAAGAEAADEQASKPEPEPAAAEAPDAEAAPEVAPKAAPAAEPEAEAVTEAETAAEPEPQAQEDAE